MAHQQQDYIDGWQTFSRWIDDLREGSLIISLLDHDSAFKKQLLECKSNLERFKLLWEDEKIHNEIERIYRSDLTKLKKERESSGIAFKSSAESKRLRDLGNVHYKNNEFTEALLYYSKAAKVAPHPVPGKRDDSLALALANRSAALFALTRYKLCIRDIDLAMKFGYPQPSLFKLYIRKLRCLHILSEWSNDCEQLKDALRCMVARSDTKQFIRNEINGMFHYISQAKPEEIPRDESDFVRDDSMLVNVNKNIPAASECLELVYEEKGGRYLIATKEISFGRLLMLEKPYVANLAPSKLAEYCYQCFSPVLSCGLSCSGCNQILYCSSNCLEENLPIHSYECESLLDFHTKLGVSYLATHIMFKINFDFSQLLVNTKRGKVKKSLEEILEVSAPYTLDYVLENDYTSVLWLQDHASEFDYDGLMGFAITAVYLMIAFKDQIFQKKNIQCDERQQLITGSVVLRHLLQLQTNLISILAQNFDNVVSIGHRLSGLDENPIGIGIYPTMSLFNHSCRPNIFSIFLGTKFMVHASKYIKCGKSVNYCYGPGISRLSKKDRQDRLKSQYFFDCECDWCANNEEDESRALLCPDCAGPVIYNIDLSHRCLKCKAENNLDVSDVLEKLKPLRLELDRLCEEPGAGPDKLQKLKSIESRLQELVHWKSRFFIRLKCELVDCANEQGDLESATKYSEEELKLTEKMHGEGSFEAVMCKLKCINYQWRYMRQCVEREESNERKLELYKALEQLIRRIFRTRQHLKDLVLATGILGAESSFDKEFKFLSSTYSAISEYLIAANYPLRSRSERAQT